MNEKELNINNIDDEQLLTDHEALVIRRALRRKHIPAPDVDQEWTKFSAAHGTKAQNITMTMKEETSAATSSTRRAHIVGFLLGVAASLAVLLALYPILKSQFMQQNTIDGVQIFSANDDPTEVMLTQDNGKPMTVRDDALVFGEESTETPSVTMKNSPQKLLTLTTPRGKDYRITLADGTKVWMNAESKLEFPETFNGNTREVALHGEAYFEVAKDAKHPFIVKTDYFNTKVLGTSFNIRAYSERDANVVLVEGSVKVGMSGKETEHTLKPGQQFSILNSQFSIKDVDTYPYTQWRDGFFYFDDTAMIEIMQELGRWYNVNIIFEEAKYMNTHLHFVAERRLSLSDIIRNINDLGIVNVEIQKDALIVN